MPQYAFSAAAPDGKMHKGELAADTEVAALDVLSRRGLTPVSLMPATGASAAGPWWAREISFFGTAGEVAPHHLQRFFATLSTLLRAYFPLQRAMDFCIKQTSDATLRRALLTAHAALENGAPLSDAMAEAGTAIPERFRLLIRIGEASNTLPEVVARAANMLALEEKLRTDLRSALIYPYILLAMSFLVLALIVFYLAPTLLPVFASAGAAPPRMLAFLANAGALLQRNAIVVMAGMVGLGLVGFVLRDALGRPIDAFMARLPVIGTYIRKINSLHLCQTMALMLVSGSSLPRAIEATRKSAASKVYAGLLARVENKVTAGSALTPALRDGGLIDPMALAMIEAGEAGDRLADMLDAAAQTLRAETAQTLEKAVKLLTPILTLVIGVGVGALILSVISAIMDMNDIAF